MKRLFLTACLALLPLALPAQGSVSFQAMPAKDAIVRTVGEEHRLLYNEPSSNQGFFILTDGIHARQFGLPYGMRVHDVEVWKDRTAYFCGEMNGSGVVGFFDIEPAFNGGAPVHYGVTVGMFYDINCTNCDMTVTSIHRLALFNSGDTIAMAMVAEGYSSYIYGNAHRTTVMSAFIDPSSGDWDFCAAYNKQNLLVFTDIACTDNYVVAAATDTNQSECLVKTYNKFSRFPHHATDYSAADKIDYLSPAGPVKVVAMDADYAALVQFNNVPGTNVHFVEFATNPGHAVPFRPSLTTSPVSTFPYSSAWALNEVRYSRSNHLLYILGWMNIPASPSFYSWILPISTAAFTVPFPALNPTARLQMSIDVVRNGDVTSCGLGYGNLLDLYPLIAPSATPTACVHTRMMDASQAAPVIKRRDAFGEEIMLTRYGNTFDSTPDDCPVAPECIAH